MIAPGATEVVIGRGLPEAILPNREGRSRVMVLTQPAAEGIAEAVRGLLEATGLATGLIVLPDRDDAKTLDQAKSVYRELAGLELGRQDTIVCVGGGAVTDLGGFVSGTWLRGVEVVHVPTTLLAAVDASIGGKTGVNLMGKNLVGVFWHPTRVVIDVQNLETLPEPLLIEGYAEAMKAGLVGDPGLFELFESGEQKTRLEEVVRRAVAVKQAVVAADEREAGARAHLNFGHTIGHAVEFLSDLSHGEAVALGMVSACHISEIVGFGETDRVSAAIAKVGLPTSSPPLDRARVLDVLGRDKKRDAGGIRMVLLQAIGVARLKHVGDDQIAAGLASIGL